ncbi:MAG: DNA repair protein RadC [Chthonomonas sp.]|nr:DNA repair protein RadC [Chthonomonas sp.]
MTKAPKDDAQDGPLQRMRHLGIRSASPVDLVAVAMSADEAGAIKSEDSARALVRRYGINLLGDLGAGDLVDQVGVSSYEACRLLAAIEIGRRAGVSAKGEVRTISNAEDIVQLFAHLRDERKEHFCIALLNSKNGVIGIRTIHIGTVNMSVVGPREVFREAIREGAVSIIAVHNHPSGNPEPSPEDLHITLRLSELGKALDVKLLDHVIIGHADWVSLAARGVL